MRSLFGIGMAIFCIPLAAFAETPSSFTAQFLGPSNHINSMNESAIVVGWVTSGGSSRAFVAGANHAYELLPLPAGMVSSTAEQINDAGVIVGAVSPSYSPEYYLQSKAARWTPDGQGGWTISLLGQLPGHVSSGAMAINNVGDIVGYSFSGMFRLPVLFGAAGPIDLSSTGIFDPCDVNDQRIVVDQSFTAKKLDLNTMQVEDLGIPEGTYLASRAEAINNSGVVVGAALLATGSNCDHQAARHTETGWQILSICGPANSAYDVNAPGDAIMQLNVAVHVNLVGLGTFRVEDLISEEDGHWFVINSYGNALNDSRQIAVQATNPTTGESGAILLTPDGSALAAGSIANPTRLSVAPNPFRDGTTIHFDASGEYPARITIHDVTGRVLRTFSGGDALRNGSIAWDGRDEESRELASGVYFAKITNGSEVEMQKVVKLK